MLTPGIPLRNSPDMLQDRNLSCLARQHIFTRNNSRYKSVANKLYSSKKLRYLSEFSSHPKFQDILNQKPPIYNKISRLKFLHMLNFNKNSSNSHGDYYSKLAIHKSLKPLLFPKKAVEIHNKSLEQDSLNAIINIDITENSGSLVKSLERKTGRKIVLSKLANKSYNIIFETGNAKML